METLSKYKGWKLSNPKIAQPQLNMEIATIQAEVWDAYENKYIHKVILMVSNNNCQFEVVIPKDAWDHIKL